MKGIIHTSCDSLASHALAGLSCTMHQDDQRFGVAEVDMSGGGFA